MFSPAFRCPRSIPTDIGHLQVGPLGEPTSRTDLKSEGQRLGDVAALLARSDSKLLIERRKEFGEGDAAPSGEAIDDIHGGHLTASLQVTQVGPMQPRAVGQLFL